MCSVLHAKINLEKSANQEKHELSQKAKYAKINLKKSANQEKHKLSQKATSFAQKPSTIQVM
eukprot:UN12269